MLINLWGDPAHPNWRFESDRWCAGTMPSPYVLIGDERNGRLQWEWRPNVARINEVILNCTAFLYESQDAAHTGSPFGGTAFLVAAPFGESGDGILYLVTAAHNVRSSDPGDPPLTWVRMNAPGGGFEVGHIAAEKWFTHQDGSDIAVAVFGGFMRLPKVTWLSLQNMSVGRDDDIGIGDPVFMVGRLLTYEGRYENLPSLRFGNISMMPSEPLPAMPPEIPTPQEAIIVEMRSIGGYSGSPVFVYNEHADDALRSAKLLGVDYCHLSTLGDPNAGMAGVIPAWKVRELIEEHEGVVEDRDEKLKEDTPRKNQGQIKYLTPDAGKKPGPEPERLSIDSTMEEVARRVIGAGKPDASEGLDD